MFIIPFRIIQFGWHERLWKTALYKPCQHSVCFLRRNIFQDVLHRDTLVKAFLDQVSVKPEIVRVNDMTCVLFQYIPQCL